MLRSNISEFLKNILSARYGKDVRQSIHDAIVEIDSVADTAQTSASKSAESAALSARVASTCETNAKNSEENAKNSEEKARTCMEQVYAMTPEMYQTVINEFNSINENLPANIREYSNKATAAPTTALDELTGAGIWYEYNKVCTGVPEELEGKTILALIKNEVFSNITIQTLSTTSNGVISSWQRRYSSTGGWGNWYKCINSNDMAKLKKEIGTYTSTSYAEVGYKDEIVVGATICMQKLSKTRCNLYISYKIWTNNETDSNIFYFMSGEKIRNALGLKTLRAVASQSQVTFTPSFDVDSNGNLTVVSVETAIGIMGHTGVKAVIDATGLQIGRIYNDTGTYGSWPVGTFSDSLFKVNTYGQINFYGASYSI